MLGLNKSGCAINSNSDGEEWMRRAEQETSIFALYVMVELPARFSEVF